MIRISTTLPLSLLLLQLLLQLHSASAAGPGAWGYGPSNGPSRWPELVPTWCSGRRQSPIHLQESAATLDPSLVAHTFLEPNINSTMFTLMNNGNGFSLSFNDSVIVRMGQSNTSCYRPHSMHWHWGSSSNVGSEHWLEGRQYPMEGHIVMWDCHLYTRFEDAFQAIDGLAVLGVVYQEGATFHSSSFQAIHSAMMSNPELIQCNTTCNETGFHDGTGVEIPAFSLRTLLPNDISSFFMYDGSLTTPDCRENVLWTVYKNPITVPTGFLTAFRSLLKYNNDTMSNNYRILQQLNPTRPMGPMRMLSRSFGATATTTTTTATPQFCAAAGMRAVTAVVVGMAAVAVAMIR